MISVIVPFKNAAKWISKCADSLHNQEGEFEFIFINDNSSDKGEELIKQYEDDRFILVDNQHKAGVGGARNTGLDIAKGDWITFLDADDQMLPGAKERFDELLKVDADIHQANHSRYYHTIDKTVTKYTNKEGFFTFDNLLECKCWCMVWNKLIKAELVEDVRFDETMRYGEDELFILECMVKANKMHHGTVSTTLHCFYNRNSLSRIKKEKDLWRQIKGLEKFIQAHDDTNVKVFVCKVLSEHWGSNTVLRGIGGADIEGW